MIELLGRTAEESPLPEGIAGELQQELHAGIADLAAELDPADPVFVSKHALATIHGCEAHHLGGSGEFEWTVANARGTVAHKAIEVMVHFRGEPFPGHLVDESIARQINDEHSSLGAFLARLPEYDRAELRAEAVAKVAAFQECFPPLSDRWRPVVESRSRVELFGGRVILSGKTDLTLGRAPNKVIVDLKTGWVNAAHREDLRFYALVETLKLGQPPRKLASYYLDSARTHPEQVTEGTLHTATRRTIDGVRRMIEIGKLDEPATKRPGPQCRWCALQPACEEGTAALVRAADPDGDQAPW